MLDQRADLLGHPRRQPSPSRRKLFERLSRERLCEPAGHRTALPWPKPRQRTNRIACRSSSERQLPSGRVLEFNDLGTEAQAPARSRGQVDRTDRYLSGEPQRIGGGSTMSSNRVASRSRQSLKNGRHTWRSRFKPRLDFLSAHSRHGGVPIECCASVGLTLTALTASLVPALRAARIDPAETLR
jgi:hypothetical protein